MSLSAHSSWLAGSILFPNYCQNEIGYVKGSLALEKRRAQTWAGHLSLAQKLGSLFSRTDFAVAMAHYM